jgi:hypothetical protein
MTPSTVRRARLAFVAAASLAGALAVVVFPTGITFAFVFAVATGIAGWSMVRRWDLWGASGNVWAGALVGFATAASILGVQRLPVPLDVRLSVGFLLLSVSVASAGLAIEFVYEAADSGLPDNAESRTGSGRPDSDGQ